MNESLLSSSGDSLELSIKENTNDILDSYSILFDKAKHNFSTSSEVSFNKHEHSIIDHNQIDTKEISTAINNVPTEKPINFNPFLLFFTENDEQESNPIELNALLSMKTISTNRSTDSFDETVTRCVSPQRDSLRTKIVTKCEQNHSKK
ncbi:unnamed protein product [Adineta steineri]|uniref:Uncharacterized protein n=1 Tax=Adineta steineri TaxID=433720 RepID=A0A815ITR5_9BILA|nr:unnamed protein product [Adineta steineri]CAF1603844.1 unnamed protein product [Adineta steineri]